MNYTKGEWKINGTEIKVFGRGTVAKCPSPNNGGVMEFLPNIHLISAAPDMYEALKLLASNVAMFHLTEPGMPLVPAYELAKKALSKAEVATVATKEAE